MSNWVNKQVKERPFFSALVVLLIVMVPGYWRLENAVDTANDAAESAEQTAEDLETATLAQQKENEEIVLDACLTRNTASQNGRDRFTQLFNGIEAILLAQPDQTEAEKERIEKFVDSLRNTVPLDPTTEDVDCNADGKLDQADYAVT
jgi:hypothetical protein